MAPERDSLGIPTEAFFYKPMCALFHSFTLRAYDAVGCRLEMPALDLGCNDGVFGSMLAGMLGQSVSLIGLDIDGEALKKCRAKQVETYSSVIQGNGTRLPFSDSSFATVFSNAVLSGVPERRSVVREVRRILAPGGRFYCSVETSDFGKSLLVGRLLRRLGLASASEAYVRRIGRRLRGADVSLSAAEWVRVFQEEGFSVQQAIGAYPSKRMPLWSLLAWTPVRAFGLLKLIPLKSVRRGSSMLQRRLFLKARLGVRKDLPPDEGSSILVCMSK
jgi:SAM-dependent methyltransferase